MCSSQVSPPVAQELFRRRLRPGLPKFSDLWDCPVSTLQDFVLPEDEIAPPSLGAGARWFGDVADALGWRFEGSWEMRNPTAHITRFEAGAARAAFRAQTFRAKTPGFRALDGVDCDPVAFALAKGRSRSHRLNSVFRRLSCEALLAEGYPAVLRIPSLKNPSDAPSRRRRVRSRPAYYSRGPDQTWAERFVRGDTSALDCASRRS